MRVYPYSTLFAQLLLFSFIMSDANNIEFLEFYSMLIYDNHHDGSSPILFPADKHAANIAIF